MAYSFCALDLRAAAAAKDFFPVMENSRCRLMGRVAKCQRRMICPKAALTISQPAMANNATASLVPSPYREFPLHNYRPTVEPAADVYVKKMVEEERAFVTAEKLDQWIRESIGEIVRNISDAPFLMHIFSDSGRGDCSTIRLEKETASPENWPRIRKRWDAGRTPDAVILVEELEEEESEAGAEEMTAAAGVASHRSPRKLGLVVQGRGMDCAACYILNTTRVMSTMGFCTHFSLVRAKCFGEPVDVQLRNAWLVQGR
ncbi:hypothetical protein Cni_G27202 [Canna indica]|uniref:DUF7804 domain-containing protein n=1 Tax=Canna indica TaxID=4628 RepID=A0AAQ3L7F9_9LILI|nr:hypothetical protein Cni_G27202 [Canna indica]